MKPRFLLRRTILWASLCAAIFLFPAFGSAAIVNGGFESGLVGWTTGGSTFVGLEATIAGESFTPVEGDIMAGLTYPAMTGFVWDNYIHQDVTLGPDDKFLSFYYNFWTFDEAPFDDPGFLVEINNDRILSVKAGDIGDGTVGTLDYTGWQFYSIPVSSYYSPDPRPASIRISFNAGNTGDNDYASGVFIDGVAMSSVPVPTSVLLLASGIVGLVGLRRRTS